LHGRIAYSLGDDVWIANANGMGAQRLTRRRGPEFDPSWSPDGRRIAYRDSRHGINRNDDIYVINADGTTPATSLAARITSGRRAGLRTAS
jgi:Tol biopolymer transport system component